MWGAIGSVRIKTENVLLIDLKVDTYKHEYYHETKSQIKFRVFGYIMYFEYWLREEKVSKKDSDSITKNGLVLPR